MLARFRIIKDEDKKVAVEKLVVASTPDFDYFFLVGLAVLVAACGLLLGSPAVVIGSMLIAPILFSVLSVSLALSVSDYRLLSRSLTTLLKSCLLAIGLAALTTLLANSFNGSLTEEILQRTEPSLLYFAVALLSGLAVSYTLVHQNLNETLPGIAVSVSLLPPLAVIGIGLAKLNWMVVQGSLTLFAVNVAGIVFASMVSFALMDLHNTKKTAQTAIDKEERRVESERAEVEKIEQSEQAASTA